MARGMAKRTRALVPLLLPDDCVAHVAMMVYRHHSQDMPNVIAVLIAMGSRGVWTIAANALMLKDPDQIQTRPAFRSAFLTFHQEILAQQRAQELQANPTGGIANIAGPVPRPVFYGMVLRAPHHMNDVVPTYYIVTRAPKKIAKTCATFEMRKLKRPSLDRHLVRAKLERSTPYTYAHLKLPNKSEFRKGILDIPLGAEARCVRLADSLNMAPYRL